MLDSSLDSVRYLTFESFAAHGLPHGVFTRRGGVSAAPFAALNVGGTVGDDPAAVQENRRRLFAGLGRRLETLFDVWQVHGVEAARGDAPRPLDQPHRRADIILTDRPEVTLFMRFADCTPILLFDPQRKAVCLAHAGWQGTVQDVAGHAVAAMQRAYASRPRDLLAAIGPSIGQHHYEVGAEVIAAVRRTFGPDAPALLRPSNGGASGGANGERQLFDLWAANRLLLARAGVQSIEVCGVCTACAVDDWYSHRAERGRTGRFGALIGL